MQYNIIRTNRKTLCLQVTKDGEVVVRSPILVSEKKICQFVDKHALWIERTVARIKSAPKQTEYTKLQIKEMKACLYERILPRIDYYSRLMGLKYNSVKITSANKRFGSCGTNGNICFSYRLADMDDYLVDYVIVHELAHIKHHNHSAAFYKLVEKYLPDQKLRRSQLLK